MLYVFNKNEVLQTVLSNDGAACPVYNAVHDEKINLENTFTFEIPADHTNAQFVVEGSLIAFQDLDLNWQMFEVKRIVDMDDTTTIKQVFCDHAFYELLGDIVPSGGGNATSAWLAVTSALSQSRWEVGNIVNLGIQTTAFSYQTALGCLQQIATTWQGELQFRIIIVNGVITHRYIDLVAQRGTSAGKQFVFGKDLEKIEREVDFNGLYTAMYGRGKATTEGARLNFASINAGLEYVADAGALAQYGLVGGTRHRFGIFDDSQESDPAVLLTKTTAALQLAKVPIVNYQFQVISLEQISPDYSHEAVRIGDTCIALDDNFVPALQVGVRVIEIKRDLLEYDKTQITLGNFRLDLARSQMFQNQVNRQVQDNSGIWDNGAALVPSVLDPAIYELTNELRSAGGYVVFSKAEGIMIYNTPDPNTATSVMKLGGGIFGIADSKDPVTGDWEWRTFGSGTGFTADLITAGKMMADRIQIGTGAQVLGNSTFYWDTSGLYAISGSNVVKINSEGVSIGTAGVGGAFSLAITGAGIVLDPDATISWVNVTSKPFIPSQYTDGEALAAWEASGYKTYIDANGIYTGTLIAQQVKGLLLEGVTIKAGKIIGIDDAAILYIGEYNGSINTYRDVTPDTPDRAAMRIVPGSLSTSAGYLQIIEDGAMWLYGPDGVEYAYIRPAYDSVTGTYHGITNLFPSVIVDGVAIQLAQIWVQATAPTEAKLNDVWINPNDYSRYDKTELTVSTTLLMSDNEVIVASGTISVTLHVATAVGVIKKIYNAGVGIVTIKGTINGVTNMLLYPKESIELITDGIDWRC